MKLLHLWRGDEILEINFEFKWKQPATKMFSEKNLLKKSYKTIFSVSAVNCYCTYICKGSNRRLFGLLFKTFFKISYFDTMTCNYLKIELLEFFWDWFCMFNLYNFIFQRLIWKMISVSFLCFDYWTLREWKTAKVQNRSVSA